MLGGISATINDVGTVYNDDAEDIFTHRHAFYYPHVRNIVLEYIEFESNLINQLPTIENAIFRVCGFDRNRNFTNVFDTWEYMPIEKGEIKSPIII